MLVLAIDTAANLCATCVLDAGSGTVRARRSEDIGTGHAERLMDMLAEVLAEAGASYGDLERIGVAVGPGSFTGVRIGVAAARGLGLALGVPVVGISTLEALGHAAAGRFPDRPSVAAIDAKRGELYAQLFDAGGVAQSQPLLASPADVAAMARRDGAVLIGSGVPVLTDMGASTVAGLERTGDIAAYAALAALKQAPLPQAKPLYLRGADAKPQQGFALRHAGAGA